MTIPNMAYIHTFLDFIALTCYALSRNVATITLILWFDESTLNEVMLINN